MATPHAYPERTDLPGDAQTPSIVMRYPAVLERWRERKRTRLISARNRRVLVRWLRTTAKRAADRDSIGGRRDVLLHYRAAAVRTDLLEIAALLERAPHPDPECVAALHDLLANHPGDSPLYNPNTPFNELQATLDYVRTGI